MKSIVKTAALLISAHLMPFEASAADYRQNPFTLTYNGAITNNAKNRVNLHSVTYQLNNIDIAANAYTLAHYDAARQYPTIVIRTKKYPVNAGGNIVLAKSELETDLQH